MTVHPDNDCVTGSNRPPGAKRAHVNDTCEVECLTSIPGWRKTLRVGTTSWFGVLKSLLHKYIKLQLVCYYSLAIFLQGFGL